MRNFPRQFQAPIRTGKVTVAFRDWAYPRVQVGQVYDALNVGNLFIEDCKRVNLKDIREADALAAGWRSLADFRQNYEQIHPGCNFEHERAYRIRFRYMDGTRPADAEMNGAP
jgi:hypothetical protein